jgi:hypothetical protein
MNGHTASVLKGTSELHAHEHTDNHHRHDLTQGTQDDIKSKGKTQFNAKKYVIRNSSSSSPNSSGSITSPYSLRAGLPIDLS